MRDQGPWPLETIRPYVAICDKTAPDTPASSLWKRGWYPYVIGKVGKSPVKAGKVEGWKKLIAGATGALVVVNAQWVANCFLLSLGP